MLCCVIRRDRKLRAGGDCLAPTAAPVLRSLQPSTRLRTADPPHRSPLQRGRWCWLHIRSIRALLSLLAITLTLAALHFSWYAGSGAITNPVLLGTYQRVRDLATDGRVIALLIDEGDHSTLRLRSLLDGKETVLVATAGELTQVTLALDHVIWQERPCPACPGRVLAYRISTGERFVLANSADEQFPRAWSHWVAWNSRNGNDRLFVTSLATPMTVVNITYVVPAGHRLADLQLSAGRLVWREITDNGSWVIRMRHVAGSDSPVTLLQGTAESPVLLLTDGRLLIIDNQMRVVALDHSSEELTIGTSPSHLDLVATDDRYLFWVGSSPSAAGNEAVIGFDLTTASRFVALPHAHGIVRLAAGGGWLLWLQHSIADRVTLWGAPISDLLPTARRAAPEAHDPRWRYFPETGHYLANGFRAFWERFGGIKMFGYPITEEFEEFDSASGQFRTVQYFERARFSWQPDSSLAIDGVVLDRIGVELAEVTDLLSSRAFRPPSATGDDITGGHCRYFEETAHRICGAFLDFWLRYGVTTSATGPTELSALQRFGLPISEPFATPDGTIVQYFERARFEYRATSDAEAVLAFGRIGTELLARRGWTP